MQQETTLGEMAEAKPKRSLRNLWVVTATSFFTDISSEMILNLLSLYLANVLHITADIIGLIEGTAETTSSLLKGISGWLSDKLRARKWLTVSGYGLSALSKPFLYFTTTWFGVLVVRFADRAGKGIRTAPRDALLADSVNEKNRGFAFGIHRAGDTAGAMLGLIIALLVVLSLQGQAVLLSGDTFRTLVLISIAPALLAVVVLAGFARDVPVKPRKDGAPRLTLRALGPRFQYFLMIMVIFTLGNSSDAFLVLRANERGMSVAAILGMLITFNLLYALMATPLGTLSDRIGRRRVIMFGWLAYGLIYLGFAAATEAWHLWALYALYGLYYAAVEGVAKALVADLVPAEQRGAAYGYYNAAIGLAALPASLLAGELWNIVGPSAPFVAGAGLALVAMIMLVTWQRRAAQQT